MACGQPRMADGALLWHARAAMRSYLLPLASVFLFVACSKASPPDSSQPTEGAAAPGATAGAQGKGVGRASNTPLQPLSKTKFGNAITETSVTPLNALVQDPSRFNDKTVRTEGTVTAVCQSKGCWMQIADESGTAHVKFAGYSFFVPREASGHRAVIQGKLLKNEADECAAKDGCREKSEKETGAVAKLEFEATGVEFVD